MMSRKRHSPEQIINKLPLGFAQGGEPAEPRQAEVAVSEELFEQILERIWALAPGAG